MTLWEQRGRGWYKCENGWENWISRDTGGWRCAERRVGDAHWETVGYVTTLDAAKRLGR